LEFAAHAHYVASHFAIEGIPALVQRALEPGDGGAPEATAGGRGEEEEGRLAQLRGEFKGWWRDPSSVGRVAQRLEVLLNATEVTAQGWV
jgi:hypothetical protein